MKAFSDNEILKFFQGFKQQRTADKIIQDYIYGKINKEEYLKQMKEALND